MSRPASANAREGLLIYINGAIVTLRAEVKQQDSQTKDERTLPSEVDPAEAQAKYADGVLTLLLPKKQRAASSSRVRVD